MKQCMVTVGMLGRIESWKRGECTDFLFTPLLISDTIVFSLCFPNKKNF